MLTASGDTIRTKRGPRLCLRWLDQKWWGMPRKKKSERHGRGDNYRIIDAANFICVVHILVSSLRLNFRTYQATGIIQYLKRGLSWSEKFEYKALHRYFSTHKFWNWWTFWCKNRGVHVLSFSSVPSQIGCGRWPHNIGLRFALQPCSQINLGLLCRLDLFN